MKTANLFPGQAGRRSWRPLARAEFERWMLRKNSRPTPYRYNRMPPIDPDHAAQFSMRLKWICAATTACSRPDPRRPSRCRSLMRA